MLFSNSKIFLCFLLVVVELYGKTNHLLLIYTHTGTKSICSFLFQRITFMLIRFSIIDGFVVSFEPLPVTVEHFTLRALAITLAAAIIGHH